MKMRSEQEEKENILIFPLKENSQEFFLSNCSVASSPLSLLMSFKLKWKWKLKIAGRWDENYEMNVREIETLFFRHRDNSQVHRATQEIGSEDNRKKKSKQKKNICAFFEFYVWMTWLWKNFQFSDFFSVFHFPRQIKSFLNFLTICVHLIEAESMAGRERACTLIRVDSNVLCVYKI